MKPEARTITDQQIQNGSRLILGALALMMCLAQVTNAAAVIQPGDAAPQFTKKSTAGQPFMLDGKLNDTVMLVFTKPGDRHGEEALRAVEKIFDGYPPLLKGMRVAVIVCRASAAEVKVYEKKLKPRWPVLTDPDDALYKGYKIVATPTVVVLDGERKVTAVHAGYDPGMQDEVRVALAKARGIELPQAMTGKVEKPNMALQMGRRMAARGLWESALKYYADAEKQGALTDQAKLELAEVQVEVKDADAALALVKGLPEGLQKSERATKVVERAAKIKAGGNGEPLKPPAVTR